MIGFNQSTLTLEASLCCAISLGVRYSGASLSQLTTRGPASNAQDKLVWRGPHICTRCVALYQVPAASVMNGCKAPNALPVPLCKRCGFPRLAEATFRYASPSLLITHTLDTLLSRGQVYKSCLASGPWTAATLAPDHAPTSSRRLLHLPTRRSLFPLSFLGHVTKATWTGWTGSHQASLPATVCLYSHQTSHRSVS